MARVQLLQISGKEIISVDYSGCKPDEMIAVFDEAKEMVVRKNGDGLLLSDFERCYVTPSFMRHAEREMLLVKHLIKKNAFIGLTFPQRMILKGFKLFLGENDYLAFDVRQEAINYLTSADITHENN